MPDLPELGFLSHSASLPWLLGAAVLLSLGAILVLAGLTALFGLHPLRFVSRTLLGLLLFARGPRRYDHCRHTGLPLAPERGARRAHRRASLPPAAFPSPPRL